MGYLVVRLEKRYRTGVEKLVAYSQNENVLYLLNTASNKIINETFSVSKKILCERILLDKVLEQGYILRFL